MSAIAAVQYFCWPVRTPTSAEFHDSKPQMSPPAIHESTVAFIFCHCGVFAATAALSRASVAPCSRMRGCSVGNTAVPSDPLPSPPSPPPLSEPLPPPLPPSEPLPRLLPEPASPGGSSLLPGVLLDAQPTR